MIEKGHLKTIDTFLDELIENEMILTMSKKNHFECNRMKTRSSKDESSTGDQTIIHR